MKSDLILKVGEVGVEQHFVLQNAMLSRPGDQIGALVLTDWSIDGRLVGTADPSTCAGRTVSVEIVGGGFSQKTSGKLSLSNQHHDAGTHIADVTIKGCAPLRLRPNTPEQ